MIFFLFIMVCVIPAYAQDDINTYDTTYDNLYEYYETSILTNDIYEYQTENLNNQNYYYNDLYNIEDNTNENINYDQLFKILSQINIPAYKTYNIKKLSSSHIPEMFTSSNLLENLSGTFWQLKYYNHIDIKFYETIQLSFSNFTMNVSIISPKLGILEQAKYNLKPLKMISLNEGIFIHKSENNNTYVYIKLFQRHLLIVKILDNFNEIQQLTNISILELPIFIIL